MFDNKEVERNLSNVIEKLLPESITKGLTDAINTIANDGKGNAPVDDGILKASITTQVEGNKAVVGTNVEYAPYIHEGTGIYATGGGITVPWSYEMTNGDWVTTSGQKANPFLQDAVDSNMGTILNHFKGVLND